MGGHRNKTAFYFIQLFFLIQCFMKFCLRFFQFFECFFKNMSTFINFFFKFCIQFADLECHSLKVLCLGLKLPGINTSTGRFVNSLLLYPNIFSAAGFASMIRPRPSVRIIPSVAFSNKEVMCAWSSIAVLNYLPQSKLMS